METENTSLLLGPWLFSGSMLVFRKLPRPKIPRLHGPPYRNLQTSIHMRIWEQKNRWRMDLHTFFHTHHVSRYLSHTHTDVI